MSKIIVFLILLFVIGISAEANADTKRVQKAQAIAVEKWGNICDGQVKVYRAELEDGRIAEAGDCEVRFQKNMVLYWESFCTAMIHEYGHLFGYTPPAKYFNPANPNHSTDPRSVMFPYQTAWHPSCIRGSSKGVRKTWR